MTARKAKTVTATAEKPAETDETTETVEKPKRGRKPKGEAPELPPLDVAALAVEAAPVPTRKTRAAAHNPFTEHVKDSYEYEEGRAVVVDAIQKGRVESLIRRAADALGIGVSIQIDDVDGDRVKVSFAGKERRKRKSAEEVAAETESDEASDVLSADAE